MTAAPHCKQNVLLCNVPQRKHSRIGFRLGLAPCLVPDPILACSPGFFPGAREDRDRRSVGNRDGWTPGTGGGAVLCLARSSEIWRMSQLRGSAAASRVGEGFEAVPQEPPARSPAGWARVVAGAWPVFMAGVAVGEEKSEALAAAPVVLRGAERDAWAAERRMSARRWWRST